MRVLQVINSLATGGAEKLILESIPKYLEQGITMELLLLDGSPQPFLKQLEGTNCRIHLLSQGSVYRPSHIFKIIPFLKQYDVVHVHLFPTLYWVALAKMLSFSKVKLVYTEHNTSNRRRGFFFKWFDRFIYNRYNKIVVITSEVGENLAKHLGRNPAYFELIHNGIDIDKFHLATTASRDKFSISEDQKILIQVSSFTAQKDQQTPIKALSQIEGHPALLLVGTGPLQEDCKQLTRDLGLVEVVQFLGTRMDVPQLLKMADVVVLSSHYEGLSLSSMEGLASGTPFVASNVPGLREVVEGAGVLFPEGDDKALAQEVTRLFADAEYSRSLGVSGVARAKQFSIEKMISKHISLYNELCKNPS